MFRFIKLKRLEIDTLSCHLQILDDWQHCGHDRNVFTQLVCDIKRATIRVTDRCEVSRAWCK